MADGSTQATLSDDDAQAYVAGELVLLVVGEHGTREVGLPRHGSVLIGRGSDVDVSLSDPRVSRRQLRIHLTHGLEVEDLGAMNGTFIGRERVPTGQKRSFCLGDFIEVCGTVLVVRRAPGRESEERLSGVRAVLDRAEARETLRCPEAMQKLHLLADRAAQSNISVLILGETGVGKDVLAERIHRGSPRSEAPLVRLNCAALSPTLLESELFGYERGAFTGANTSRPGLLRSAHGGTVFLDEIGELPLELQAKLLLVIERREVTAVGAVRPRVIDVRFIAATNADLSRRVEEGSFRRDLYFRLDGVTLRIPPLRERVAEIAALARNFAEQAARSAQRPTPVLSDEVIRALEQRVWPGNIRELKAIIERATLLGTSDVVALEDVLDLTEARIADAAPSVFSSERDRISKVLADCGGNQSRAAKVLGISRNTLIARIKRFQLTRPIGARAIRHVP